MIMSWKFEVCEDWSIIQGEVYKKKWLDLLEKSPSAHVFFHPALVKAWMETYFPLRDIKPIFVWGHNGDNEVFFPLVYWKKNWKNAFLRSIVPAGYSDFDYHDPIFRSDINKVEVEDFWANLCLFLNKYKYDEIVFDGIHERNLSTCFDTIYSEPCPYIPICGISTLDEFKSTLPRKLRLDINRRTKKASEMGEIEILTYDYNSIDSAISIIPHMLHLHSQRWPKAYKAPNFHKNLIAEGLKSCVLFFNQMNINNLPISWRIGFIYKSIFYSYMPTIDPNFLKLSPGKLHLINCIDYAITNNYSKYDQLRGSELYKSEWTSQYDTIYNIRKRNTAITSQIKYRLNSLKTKLFK